MIINWQFDYLSFNVRREPKKKKTFRLNEHGLINIVSLYKLIISCFRIILVVFYQLKKGWGRPINNCKQLLIKSDKLKKDLI